MDKVRKKFVFYAEIAVLILLTVLLSVLNIINFTMVADDADRMTEAISRSPGKFYEARNNPSGFGRSFGMGPDSPEMNASLRYFTYAVDKEGNVEQIEHRMSAVPEAAALEWVQSLVHESTGWTHLIYRYRVYEKDDKTFVTVIDQGRELLPSYRILLISAVGEVLVLLISYLVLLRVGKKLFEQFDEADRKQKRFISSVEHDFKMPLTIISANTEIIERRSGTNDQTQAINRQVRKMTGLVKHLGALSIFEEKDMAIASVDLSKMMTDVFDSRKEQMKEKKIAWEAAITPDITIEGDGQALQKLLTELADNAWRYALTKASLTLRKQGDRIIILQANDTDLPNGSIDQIFDRFTTLSNAKDTDGLGLSYVKDIAKAHNGRVSAKVNNHQFLLEIAL